MRPKERRENGQKDLFKARLDQILDLDHAPVKLADAIDWRFLEDRFGAVYDDDPGELAGAGGRARQNFQHAMKFDDQSMS